jgi:hypothetical protein
MNLRPFMRKERAGGKKIGEEDIRPRTRNSKSKQTLAMLYKVKLAR